MIEGIKRKYFWNSCFKILPFFFFNTNPYIPDRRNTRFLWWLAPSIDGLWRKSGKQLLRQKIRLYRKQFADLQILRYRVPRFWGFVPQTKRIGLLFDVKRLIETSFSIRMASTTPMILPDVGGLSIPAIMEIRTLLISWLWKCTSSGYGSPMAFIITMAAKVVPGIYSWILQQAVQSVDT